MPHAERDRFDLCGSLRPASPRFAPSLRKLRFLRRIFDPRPLASFHYTLTFHSCAATNRIGRIYAGCSVSTQSQTLDAVATARDVRTGPAREVPAPPSARDAEQPPPSADAPPSVYGPARTPRAEGGAGTSRAGPSRRTRAAPARRANENAIGIKGSSMYYPRKSSCRNANSPRRADISRGDAEARRI